MKILVKAIGILTKDKSSFFFQDTVNHVVENYFYECFLVNENEKNRYTDRLNKRFVTISTRNNFFIPQSSSFLQELEVNLNQLQSIFSTEEFLEEFSKFLNHKKNPQYLLNIPNANHLDKIATKVIQTIFLKKAFINGAMIGFFEKVHLPKELGLDLAQYISFTDAQNVALTCQLSSDYAHQELQHVKSNFVNK